MSYEETLERIHSLNKFGSRPGLDRVKMLLKLLGDPQDSLRCVHVAGTNGKGSVCAVLSSVLCESGYRTGLFISPFITDFCERIQINNEPIPQGELSEIADYVFSYVDILNSEGVIITEFEFVMCVAFEYYKRQQCDIVVLETGLGGRLDCTNVIREPLCSVITRIGLDHTDILGDTVEKIALEKCGIIKDNAPVVSSPQLDEVTRVIASSCDEKQSELIVSRPDDITVKRETLGGVELEYKGITAVFHLLGRHQIDNLSSALDAVNVLKVGGFDRITDDSLKRGIENAHNPARFEIMSREPVVILDGAHNVDGIRSFLDGTKCFAPDADKILIIGMLGDKDSRSSVALLSGHFSRVYTVPINNPRALTSSDMAKLCREYFDDVVACESVQEAFDKAYIEASCENIPLCVCGSLYLAGEIRPYILQRLCDK